MELSNADDVSGRPYVMLVEDDESLARWMASYLGTHGYPAGIVTDGRTALALIREDAPDLVVLDWMLPDVEGVEVCRRAREFCDAPILMLTARDGDGDEVVGLDAGADDYLRKPLKPTVLLARVRALLRREASSTSAHLLRVGGLQIDRRSRTATLAGEPLPLTSLELDILIVLAEHAGEAVDRERLSGAVRGLTYDGLNRATDLAVSRLRRKIGDTGAKPTRVKTVRGRGYLLAPDAW